MFEKDSKRERMEQLRVMEKRFQPIYRVVDGIQDRMKILEEQMNELRSHRPVREPQVRRDIHQPVLPQRDKDAYDNGTFDVITTTSRRGNKGRATQFDRPRRGDYEYYEQELVDHPRSSKPSVRSFQATKLDERSSLSWDSQWRSSASRVGESLQKPKREKFKTEFQFETKERGNSNLKSHRTYDTKCFWCLDFGHAASECLNKPFMNLWSDYEELKRKGDSLPSLEKDDTRKVFENENTQTDLGTIEALVDEEVHESVEVKSEGEENCKPAPPHEEKEGSDSRANPFEEVEDDTIQPCVEVNVELTKVQTHIVHVVEMALPREMLQSFSIQRFDAMGLRATKHPRSHTIQWLKDSVFCDVVHMHVNHIQLGRPWQYDSKVKLEGSRSQYTFEKNDGVVTLGPFVLAQPYDDQDRTCRDVIEFEESVWETINCEKRTSEGRASESRTSWILDTIVYHKFSLYFDVVLHVQRCVNLQQKKEIDHAIDFIYTPFEIGPDSRTNPFKEGEYDTILTSSKTKNWKKRKRVKLMEPFVLELKNKGLNQAFEESMVWNWKKRKRRIRWTSRIPCIPKFSHVSGSFTIRVITLLSDVQLR